MLKDKSIKFKLMAVILIGLLLIVIIGVPLTTVMVKNGFSNVIDEQCQNSMNGLQSHIEEQQTELKELLSKATNSPGLVQLVAAGDGTNPAWAAVTSAEADGALVMTAQSNQLVSKNITAQDVSGIYNDVIGGKEMVDYVIIGDKLYMVCGKPVVYNGTTVGAGFLAYDLGNTALVDDLKAVTDNEFTVFMNNIRYNTTITSGNERQVGTPMGDDVKKVVIDQKQNYQGETEIFGKQYTVSYVPIINSKGECVGAWFSGVVIDNIVSTETKIITLIAAYLIVIAAVMFVAVYVILKKMIVKPLSQTLDISKELGEGNIGLLQEFVYDDTGIQNDEVGAIFESLLSTQNSMKTYIGEISTVLAELAQGNLSVSLKEEYMGDYVQIKESLETIIVALSNAMRDIDDSASQVAVGSSEVASGAKLLADGTIEQMDAVRDLSASMEEISSKVQKNADDAQKVTDVANLAGQKISESNEQMNKMVEAIGEINDAANEIDKIIKTIDDIAFQTNILALNAAVEAARAGDAGKGFAVVADEVRNLAGKSAQAAKETTDLIQKAVDAVGKGTVLSNKTAQALESVVEITTKIVESINSISAASEEQATAVGSVTEGISQISNVIQTVSATAQESLAISKELNGQAEALKGSVNQFRLE